MPVVAVSLLGSLACLALVGVLVVTYARIHAEGGRLTDVALSAIDGERSDPASGTAVVGAPGGGPAAAGPVAAPEAPSSPSGTASSSTPGPEEEPSPAADPPTGGQRLPDADGAPSSTSPSAGDAATSEPTPSSPGGAALQTVRGDVTYEGFGTARKTSVTYTVDGEYDGSEDLGASFSLPQKGSRAWKSWYVSVVADGSGSVGCRIRDAAGTVLVQATATGDDVAECSWGEQDTVSDQGPEDDLADDAQDGASSSDS